MVHKIYFILFYFILSYLGGGLFLQQAFSASVVKTIEKENSSNLFLPKTVNKKHPPSTPEQIIEAETVDALYFPSHFILPSDLTTPLSPPKLGNKAHNKPTDTKNTQNVMLYPSLYAQTKEFLTDNKNNEFLHDSLIIFSQTKQFLKETDLMIHNLTQNILLSLNLDTPDQEGILVLAHADAKGYSAKTSFKQQIEITKLQSFRQNSNKDNVTYSDNDLLALLFNIKNLYYFIGFVFLFFLAKQMLKFMFIKDEYNSHNRR